MDKTETKTVYAYGVDGKYIGAKILDCTDRNPISEVWQIPAGTTENAPVVKTGYDCVWSGSSWYYQAQEDKAETKTVYSYDSTGLYTGIQTLDYSDRSPIDGSWQIPGDTTELVPEEKTGYDAYFISGAWTYVAQEVNVFCYYNYGTKYKSVKSNYTVAAGEVLFDATPTTAQLKSAFPTTIGSKTFTVNNTGTVGDTIAIGGVSVTCASSSSPGETYVLGTDSSGTAANIAACLNGNSSFAAVYKATAANAVITIAEIMKGNGDDPADAVCTGTVTLTTGAVAKSIWGYTTSVLNQKISAINSAYNAEMLQIIRADDLAKLKGTSTSDHTTALASLSTWLDTEQEVAINEQ